ncbi:ABC transporter substrate-binding protein [Vibrio profundum]|uniref:ABC transporter substrate-binding protein n=1 Tax=Vibrio profundum TaxID=2910247 RepID=UPI003D12AFA4
MKLAIPLCLLALVLPSLASAKECGTITIADMNWSSASLIANVDQFILKNGYGCDAELVPGDSNPTSASMIEKGQPDVAPELWTNSLKDALEEGVKEKRLRIAGKVLSDGGEEGFWVPKYLVEQYPDLATIEGVKKHANLFKNPEDPDSFAIYGCPAGWACQITTENLFKALKLKNAGFSIVDPGSAAGLSGSLAKAYERHKPWIGYYWAPTPILGKYSMVKVDFGSGIDEKEFINCTTQADCLNPKVTMYPPGPVYTITTEKLADKAPEAYQYFSKRSFTNKDLNHLLAWMEENQADGNDAMYYFLTQYPQIWHQWVPQAVADKVDAAL